MADAKKFNKKVRIRHAGFTYHKEHDVIQPDGSTARVWNKVMALRDEEVNLVVKQDYDIGLREGAFWTDDYHPDTGVPNDLDIDDEDTVFPTADDDEISIDEASEEDLVEFVKESKVEEVLELADTKERAQKLLDAENMATGNDPRVTLEAELKRRIEEGVQ